MKIFLKICILFVIIAMLVSAGNSADAPKRTFKDFLNREVTINFPPKRIVSLAPAVTEMLFAIGLDKEIVGVTEFCDYPERAKKKKKVGGYYKPSLELIVSLNPHLVVAAADGPNKPHIDKLVKLGVHCFAVKPRTLDEILSTMKTLAVVTGREETAKKTLLMMKERVAKVDKTVKSIPMENRPKVFYALDHTDLWTTGKGTFVDDLIKRAGGINIAKNKKEWYKYNLEALILHQPDVIIVSRGKKKKEKEVLNNWQKYRTLRAVRENRVYAIDEDILSRSGPRAIDALEKLVELFNAKK